MKQREILADISPDFRRDNETQEAYLSRKKAASVDFIKRYVKKSGARGVVLGVSGGVDSFLVGALCARAMKELQKELYLVILPNGVQKDYQDAKDSVEQIGKIYPAAVSDTVSIEHAYEGAVLDLSAARGFAGDSYQLGNLQPRLRMTYQYALAKDMLVAGTDHATEAVTGFYTKYGDGGTDFNPIQELVKDDIYAMSAEFGAPEAVLKKQPAAGIGISIDDESELGMKYKDICAYLKGNRIDAAVAAKLEAAYEKTKHKRALPASLKDEYAQKAPVSIVVVDLIRAFIDGGLACTNAADAVKNTIRVINRMPAAEVLYAADRHPAGHCSFRENGGVWPSHAVCGTADADFADALYRDVAKTVNTPILRYNVFLKGQDKESEQYSACDAKNENFGLLKDNVRQEVILVGAATEYCVINTVKGLIAAGCTVTVPESCLAFVDRKGHKNALMEMKNAGAQVL